MRKMQEYIVKGNRIFIGLEDSKRTWKVCVRCERMIVHEASMPAQYEVLRAYLEKRYPECEITVMYEAGFQGFWLHDLLEADVPDRERREDRQISRTLGQIQKDITATKNRIRRYLDFHGLNGGLRPGRWYDRDYRALADLELPKSLRISLDALLRQLETSLAIDSELRAELRELCKKERYKTGVQKKSSSPGIGWFTAIRLTLEWGDMNRFKTGKHIASFTGLTSREYSTGDTVRRGRITGQSSEYVRSWLIECAWRAIRKDPVLLDKYRRVTRNSGSRKKAIVAVARKLAVRLWALETTGQQQYCIGIVE